MFWPFKRKSIEDHLNATKTIKVHSMKFKIKKINVLDHCTGAKVAAAVFDTYQVGATPAGEISTERIKSQYIDVLMAGIVYPEFSRKKEDGKILIDNLLNDWDLAISLYSEIMAYTYGKKNLSLLTSQGKKS